jgi:hypothetical protein
VTAVQDPEVQAPDPADPASGPHFDLDAYLCQFDERMLKIPECRRQLTRFDPLLFAITYLPHHLKGEEDGAHITLSEFHVELAEAAKKWALPTREPRSDRDAYICPREAGKSTWLFLILPLWAAAHGHRRFVAAFADSGGQAEMHLLSFKRELDNNTVLRTDYPKLCAAGRRPSGTTESDTKNMLVTKSGFVFATRGVDAKTLGMKLGNRRPDLIILDDIEPDEANYSDYQKGQRLSTVQNAILPLNIRARVVIAGTVTMPGSIIHDLVKTVSRPGEEPAEWVVAEQIRVHYYRAIITDEETGERRSLWEAKWPYAFLAAIEKTRSYKLNYDNNPMARDGDYWNEDDFVYGELPAITHQLLSIDPAITSKKKSDYTALAVIGYSAAHRRCVVRYARVVRIQPGKPLKRLVLRILDEFPEIRGVVVEVNQGGEVWEASVLTDLPVPVKTVHQHEPKEVRAARLLGFYQEIPKRSKTTVPDPSVAAGIAHMPYVIHEHALPAAEEQMVGFPKAVHDDLVDAIGTGVDKFLKKSKKKRSSATTYDPLAAPDDDEDDEYLAS